MDNNQQMNKEEKMVVRYSANGIEVKLTPSIVQEYIVGSNSKITAPEFKFFTELCKARQLNPFLKEAYCIKYGNSPATIVVSKDVIEQRAEDFPQYDGKESGIIVKKEDGTVEERNGCYFDRENEEILGGWCRVFRKDRSKPEYMSVSFDEVAVRKSDGNLNSNWAGKPATMVEKVAKVRALRAAFPKAFSGMYIADEMDIPKEAKRSAKAFEEQPIEATFTEVKEPIVNEETGEVDFNSL